MFLQLSPSGTQLQLCNFRFHLHGYESVYLMSNGGIQQRIMPDVKRILDECPKLNVTVALGIDGLKADHEKIRGKKDSWDRAISTARQLQEIQPAWLGGKVFSSANIAERGWGISSDWRCAGCFSSARCDPPLRFGRGP